MRDPTFNSWPILFAVAFSPLNRITEVLATTLRPPILDRTAISSSVIPSEKYSSARQGCHCRIPWHHHLVHLHRRAYILQQPSSEAYQWQLKLVLDLVVDLTSKTNPSTICE